MSVAPASDGVAGRGIGDILLAHGFVTTEELVTATAEQERTKQPLGQILVQNGSITRLELASALAEQWSDPSASITVLPRSPSSPPSQSPSHDDDQYAARLQEAVADLARRVHASEPVEGFEERLTDLGQRVESTHARTQRLEAAVATLVESLEGVTGGVEDAFTALQAGAAELAGDLARIDAAVQELALRPSTAEPNHDVEERLRELTDAVTALSGHPAALTEVRVTLDELADRLDATAETRDVDALRAAVAALESGPDEAESLEPRLAHLESLAAGKAERADVEASAAALAELAEMLTELQGRPAGNPDLDERLASLESRLDEAVLRPTDDAALETLAERFERAVEAQHQLGASVAEMETRVDGLSHRESRLDELDARFNALEERLVGDLESIEARLEDKGTHLAAELDTLRADLATAREEQPRGHDLDETMAALASRVEELALRVEEAHRVAGGLDEMAAALADVQARVGALATERRDDGLDEAIAALSSRVDELGAQARDDGGTGNRLDQIDDAVGDIRLRLTELAHEQGNRSADETIQALADRVDEVAALVHRDDGIAVRIDEHGGSLDELRTQVASLTAAHHDLGDNHDALAALASRVDELAVRPAATPVEPDGRINEFADAIAELRVELATLADSSRRHDVHDAVMALTSRVDELAGTRDDQAMAHRLDTIERERATDAETIDVLLLALDRIREDLSEREPARPEQSGEHDGRLDELGRGLVEVQAQLASFAERPPDAGFEERFEGLAARIESIDTARSPTLESDPRIDVLVQSLAELRDELASVAAQPRERAADDGLAGSLAVLTTRIDEIASAPPPAPEADPRIDVLARSVSELRDELASLASPPHDHRDDDALAQLTARVEEIAATPAPSAEPDPRIEELGEALTELRIQIDSLAAQPREQAGEEALAVLASRIDALTSAPPAVDEERLIGIEQLAGRLETLSRDLEARLAAVADPVAGEGFDASVPDQLERVRLSIERFGLHLGEHDRALADLMRSRGVERRVEELAERVDQLAAARPVDAATASGNGTPGVSADMLALARRVEEAEAASQADREKLMSRLEKLGSAIDWRLQRLEAEDTP